MLTRAQGRIRSNRGVDLISDVLPFRRLWYGEPNTITKAIGYAKFRSRSHYAVIRVYDAARNVIETHEHASESESGERCGGEAKSRHAVKHDGSLPRLVDRFQRLLRAVCGAGLFG